MGGGAHQSLIGAIAGALCCTSAFTCSLAFDQYGGIIVWIALMLYMFKALGVICDEYFVPSLEVIVDKLQLSNDVAGATFMAAGSSAPELFTSLVATFLIVNEGGVGTIVGSAIFNILVIVGATGYIACKDQSLKIWWYPLCRDCFFYSLSILELMIILSNERVEWYEGLIMFLTYCSYCVYMKFNPQIIKMLGLTDPSENQVSEVEENAEKINVKESQVAPMAMESMDTANGNSDKAALRTAGDAEETAKPPEVGGSGGAAPGAVEDIENGKSADMNASKTNDQLVAPKVEQEKRRPSWGYAETEQRMKEEAGAKPTATEGEPAAADEKPEATETPEESRWPSFLRDPLCVFWELTMPPPERGAGLALFAASILFIGICTYLMVDATNRIGVILHIPPLAMALVFLAAGTSIPDALGSIAVAKQGEGDMAVSNALGSNVFDILIGLGVPWTIKTGFMNEEVSFLGKWDELIYDIFVLVFVLFLFVGCLMAHKWYLTRKVGILLLLMYGGFLIYNVFAVWIIDPPLKEQPEQEYCEVL